MNLQYPLDNRFHSYSTIQIIKCKQNVYLYKKQKIIIIGWNSSQIDYGAFLFHKVKTNQEFACLKQMILQFENRPTYQQIKYQIYKVLGTYTVKQTIRAHGIVAFHQFLQGYYMTYITEVQPVAKIGRHKIYSIKNTAILPLFDLKSDRKTKKNEQKYFQILQKFKLQNFYFSCTYDLSSTFAKNMIRNSKKLFNINAGQKTIRNEQKIFQCSQTFQFNHQLIKQFHHSLQNKRFTLPVTHGYCKQINAMMKSTIFNIVVVARRSRHHAGTRYNKRGINDMGYVANYVEIQQIVINYTSSQDTRPVCSSFIQVRGSVPTYWLQRPSIHIPKPAIQVKQDDYMFLATRKHFKDVISRYGNLVYAVNLMKKNQKVPRESLLSGQYQTAISFINKQDLSQQSQIHYIQIDMKYHLRLDKKMFVNKMKTIAYYAIMNTGIFMCMNHSTSSNEQFVEFQNGIIRGNCVDCLDRTNSFQQLMGETALSIQLLRLIKQNVSFSALDLPQSILSQYSKLYEQMGDLISIQYGSSLAHKQKIQKTTESRFQFLIAITRHVNNNWNDYDRQQQMDVFLGYKPKVDGQQIWQIRPTIQHYPDQSLKVIQTSRWYHEANQIFLKQHFISQFQAISNRDDYQRNLPLISRFVKEDLVNKFNVDVVNALVNQSQKYGIYQFFIRPKFIYDRKMWDQANPKTKKISTLKEQLSYCYNNMDILRNQGQQPKPSMTSQKKIRTDQPHQIRKNFGMKVVNKQESSIQSQNLIPKTPTALQSQQLNQSQLLLISQYMSGCLIPDTQIQSQISQYFSLLSSKAQIDWPTQSAINQEVKNLQTNFKLKNYLYFSQLIKKEDFRINKTKQQQGKIKTVKLIQQKNQKIKQNKILILEQIMKKNFSHGNVQKIQEI